MKQKSSLAIYKNFIIRIFYSKSSIYNKYGGNINTDSKFSCIPAHILNPPENSIVIDACASPGNKTSHLASIMKNTGLIYAVEQDSNRMKVIKNRLPKFGIKESENIMCIQDDFTSLNPLDPRFSNVRYILVDPSCTGSGIFKRVETQSLSSDALNGLNCPDRISRLATFQSKILLHAFSFPAVKKVVYSTCSINFEENESVIKEVYKNVRQDFYLAPVMMKEFPTLRGSYYHENFHPENSQKLEKLRTFYEKCLRTVPFKPHKTEHFSKNKSKSAIKKQKNDDVAIDPEYLENFEIIENGFFVALFIKRKVALIK
ncbi:28S rRNA (cytosine-C(5))-methyltransferase-like [Gordionus sp. m RMFG-2023]|uniref:28S rRNA (cytosine-C(5))-methyltransferase-like n=1 Tax=Gordionus sp. m RMFG-2023 TaxID=3053472 RepID=UPI0031FD73B6